MDLSPLFDLYDWLAATRIAGAFTWLHLVIVLTIGWTGYRIYNEHLKPDPKRKYMLFSRCNNCGILAEVSEFARVCTQCRSTSLKIMKESEYKLAKQQELERRRRAVA